VPARLAIFVAQLGRKFRLISLTMQRYESFIAVYEFSGEKLSIFFLGSLLRAAALQFSKRLPTPYIYSYISIYIYIYRYIDLKFDLQTVRFRTATPQRRNSESRAKLAWALPSANGVDEVNAATARAEPSSLGLCRAPTGSTKSASATHRANTPFSEKSAHHLLFCCKDRKKNR